MEMENSLQMRSQAVRKSVMGNKDYQALRANLASTVKTVTMATQASSISQHYRQALHANSVDSRSNQVLITITTSYWTKKKSKPLPMFVMDNLAVKDLKANKELMVHKVTQH